MTGGYGRLATSRAVAQYFPRRESDRPGASVTCLDIDFGWSKLSREAILLLDIYRRHAEAPPAQDPAELKAELIDLQERGVNLNRQQFLVLTLRKTLAVHQLGRAMSREKPRRTVLTGIGAARGFCSVCGARRDSGRVWRDLNRDVFWCEEHGERQ